MNIDSNLNTKVLDKPNPSKIFFFKSLVLLLWVRHFNLFVGGIKKTSMKFLKKKSYSFSYSKAPMAHKTNSHEKYSITLNTYIIFFKFITKINVVSLVNTVLLYKFLNITRIKLSTNLLNLKRIRWYYNIKIDNEFLYL